MKKRVLIGLMSVLLVSVMVMGACSSSEKTTAPASTTAPAATNYELSIAISSSTQSPPGKVVTAFNDKLIQQSGGRVKLKIYYSSSLIEAKEVLRSLNAGVVDISDIFTNAAPGLMPLHDVLFLPGLGWPDSYNSSLVIRELETMPEMIKEWQGVKVWGYTAWGLPTILHETKKLIKVKADFAGLNINGQSPAMANFWSGLGAVPVFVNFEDMFMSLDKGIIEAQVGSQGSINAAGTFELLKYHTVLGTTLSQSSNPYIFCPATWNKFSPDIQKIFSDLEPWFTQTRIAAEANSEVAGLARAKEAGHTFYDLPKSELDSWLSTATPIHEKWIKDVEGSGSPARKVYDQLKVLIAKYKANPQTAPQVQ